MNDKLAEDYVALWQSELTAMAADRELRESWNAMVVLWASATLGMMQMRPLYPHDRSPGSAIFPQPAGTAPAAAASEPGAGEIEQLSRRVAELEQRLAALLGAQPGNA